MQKIEFQFVCEWRECVRVWVCFDMQFFFSPLTEVYQWIYSLTVQWSSIAKENGWKIKPLKFYTYLFSFRFD